MTAAEVITATSPPTGVQGRPTGSMIERPGFADHCVNAKELR